MHHVSLKLLSFISRVGKSLQMKVGQYFVPILFAVCILDMVLMHQLLIFSINIDFLSDIHVPVIV